MDKRNGYPKEQPPPYSSVQQPQQLPHQANANVRVVHVAPIAIGPNPQAIICPSCHFPIRTDVRYETAGRTHLMALLLCVLFWPIACLPYCLESCQNANHYCPNCGSYIGTYND